MFKYFTPFLYSYDKKLVALSFLNSEEKNKVIQITVTVLQHGLSVVGGAYLFCLRLSYGESEPSYLSRIVRDPQLQKLYSNISTCSVQA